MVAPSEILNQAHDETVFLRCFENHRRDLGLTERRELPRAATAAADLEDGRVAYLPVAPDVPSLELEDVELVG